MSEPLELFSKVYLESKSEETEKVPEDTEKPEVQVDYHLIAENQRQKLLLHLRDLKKKADEAHEKAVKAKEALSKEAENSEYGISLLQVRNHCFAEYIEFISSYSLSKANGEDVQPSVEALVSNRCVLEKIKPLMRQLQYQISKYAGMKKSRAANLRANPQTMIRKPVFEGPMDTMVSASYAPPQVMEQEYPQAQQDAIKEAKYARTIKARTKHSALLDEVAADLTEDVVEAGRMAHADRKLKQFMQRLKEKEQLEEETFQRLPMSKKDRAMLKQLEQTQASLGTIMDYGKISSDSAPKAGKPAKSGEKKKKKHHH